MKEIVGHERVRSFLAGALRSGRVAHAYLFAGPARIGKTTLARAFAATLLCHATQSGEVTRAAHDDGRQPPLFDTPAQTTEIGDRVEPCGVCAGCRLVAAGSHPDLMIVERGFTDKGREARNISVDQVDRLLHDISLAPYLGSRKVYVVVNAEDLSIAAMNSLLKTLEEPPPGVVLILTTSDQSRVLPTVISRCQTLNLTLVEPAEIEAGLIAHGAPPDRTRLLAPLAAGRAGWALAALADELILRQREDELTRLVNLARASRVDRLAYAETLASLATKDPEELRQRLGLWLGWWRDVALVRADCEDLVVNVDRMSELRAQGQQFHLDQLRRFVGEVDLATRRLAANVNARMALDVLLLAVPRP